MQDSKHPWNTRTVDIKLQEAGHLKRTKHQIDETVLAKKLVTQPAKEHQTVPQTAEEHSQEKG